MELKWENGRAEYGKFELVVWKLQEDRDWCWVVKIDTVPIESNFRGGNVTPLETEALAQQACVDYLKSIANSLMPLILDDRRIDECAKKIFEDFHIKLAEMGYSQTAIYPPKWEERISALIKQFLAEPQPKLEGE